MSNRNYRFSVPKKASIYSLSALLLLSVFGVILSHTGAVDAAQLSQALVRFDRMKTSTATTGTVCVKPTTVATESTADVTFPTGYTLGTAGNFTVNTTNLAWPSGATAWVGIGTASTVTSQTVTFPSGELAVGTLYCFNWTNSAAVQVKSSASASNVGSITTKDAGSATIDTASYSTASITDDQIAVSATVPQAFSFALSGNTDALGSLSTAAVASSPTPRTATVNTNSKTGWLTWAKDASTGLSSSSASATIASTTPGTNSTLSAGTEGYNFGVTASQSGGTGTLSVASAFVGTAAGQGGGLDGNLRLLASSTGTANNAVMTFKNNVAITSLTPAASDYSDIITIVGAGLF